MKFLMLAVFVLTLSGCGNPAISDLRPQTGNIVFLGDSITRGYEVEEDERYTSLIETELSANGFNHYVVINQGIDGDKTSDGLQRLEAVLDAEPEIVVLALGGNDFLRSRPLDEIEQNLTDIIATLQAENIEVVLVGVAAPPLRGLSYTRAAKRMYESVAEGSEIKTFIPNILKGMVLDQRYMQSDNIHPTALGHQKIAENLGPYLLDRLRTSN